VGLSVLTQVGAAISNLGEGRMFEQVQPATQELALRHAARLPLSRFDDPGVYDLLERNLKDTSMRICQLLWFAMDMVSTASGVISAVVLLAAVSLWVALAALLMAIPMAYAGVRAGARDFQINKVQSPGRRFTRYLGDLLSKRETATELRAYHLTPYFLERWRSSYAQRRADHLEDRAVTAKEGALAAVAAAAMFAIALGGVVYVAVQGRVGAGEIAVLISAVRILEQGIGRMAGNGGYFWEYGRPIGEFRRFLALEVTDGPEGKGLPFPAPLQGAIRFEHVTFTYPGADAPTLQDVTLEIQPGEHLALVGVNGAGKSTLTKLLLGLYRPDSGRITIGGIDVNDIATESLRAHVSCVFQDFVRYQMTLRENVAIGKLGVAPERVEAALAEAGWAP
jgi:ATP-binding cassette subfamily B protein